MGSLDSAIANEEPSDLDDNGCTYSFYKDNMVLEYGGGAIGPQCFEDFKHRVKLCCPVLYFLVQSSFTERKHFT